MAHHWVEEAEAEGLEEQGGDAVEDEEERVLETKAVNFIWYTVRFVKFGTAEVISLI